MRTLEVRFQTYPDQVRIVGELAEEKNTVYFQYHPLFLQDPLWLSPFYLKPRSEVFKHTDLSFGPIFGLFDDSLPDGWGLLLMDRYLKQQGMSLQRLSPLDRLAFLGNRTMGALTYHPPAAQEPADHILLNLHQLSQKSTQLLEGSCDDMLPELFRLGGSPGGARPKILVGMCGEHLISGADDLPPHYQHWLIKFHGKTDALDCGTLEFVYAQLAKNAGIAISPTRLFETGEGDRFFGTQRFDRDGNKRIHVHSFGNLIHANFRVPSCDYEQLLQATQVLTKNHADLLQVFRRMVFNIASHNRDDHVKNFSFLFDEQKRVWRLAPAFDLTFSEGPGGEHSMTVAGEGQQPRRHHLLALARKFAISPEEADAVLEEVCQHVAQWKTLATSQGVLNEHVQDIAKRIEQNIKCLT